MKKAFTLVEILIVVAILGILAAMVLPTLQGHIQQAKESTAKDNLRILRNTIEVYAAQHNGVPPGYKNGDPSDTVTYTYLREQLIETGNYLPDFPENPFNNYKLVNVCYANIEMAQMSEQRESVGMNGKTWVLRGTKADFTGLAEGKL